MPRASKKKDPNAPKRPLSAFFIFSQEERPKVKLQNASLSVADVAKVIGEKWRSAPEDTKRRFEKAAKEAKERYELEMQAYKQTGKLERLIFIIIIISMKFLKIFQLPTYNRYNNHQKLELNILKPFHLLRMNIYLFTYVYLFVCIVLSFVLFSSFGV